MATRRRTGDDSSDSTSNRHRPATTPEAREHQLVALAYDRVERKIRDGTASSQELVHFLKLGSSREFLEQEKIRNENKLTAAKIEQLASEKRVEALFGEALKAMRSYKGEDPGVEDEEVY